MTRSVVALPIEAHVISSPRSGSSLTSVAVTAGSSSQIAPRSTRGHLISMKKSDLGLHAWGNVVPACQSCNNARQRKDWRDYIIQRAGPEAAERHARVLAFLEAYE